MNKLFALLIGCAATVTALAETLTILVTTEGPREGIIAVLVFKEKKGFPDKHEKAFRKMRVPVTAEGVVSCVLTNLPHGTYAVSVLHDENDNRKSDKLLGFGPPKEPVGASNYDKPLKRNPKFKDASFDFNATNDTIDISVFYAF